MIQEFVDRFEAAKPAIREALSMAHPQEYKELVKLVVGHVSGNEYRHPDAGKIHEINDGDYQGTLLYLIPDSGYQPSTYWYVFVSYGSCSGCDTLEGIRGYSNDTPTNDEVEQYMTLCLHIVQGLKMISAHSAELD